MATPLTIIIPAKHEEASIRAVITSLRRHVKTPHHIIIINDSDITDKTTDRIQTHKNVKIIRKISPRGTFGRALTLGIDATMTPVVVPVMADSCDDPRDIDRMYKKIMDGYDVVCASRYMIDGKKIGGPALQSSFSWFVCTTLRFLTGIPTRDVSNAFKMYKTSVIKKIPINQTSGVEASMEIVLQAFYAGASITEIPTIWKGRTTGKSKFKFGQRVLKYLRIYLWALRTKKASPHPSTRS